ncbi:growth factor receptor-bound protein 7 isoform X2 [Hippopotamus amphibius kiboko]|nr:growth factor receptor-bound protein 7 isoform X2 [Hippopotamus amphibius kiboko]XP_057572420.1 growth factor receptor-bound protein 7 isoform X2 [Hippopotamus amphibius kiboko]XP_057572421.1 growth factor receptor-bound protein 7 isoform X2 [Hippopotamus amphibius kiboko]XP_057572422.1 growth factor receptor-bound protein 7 isoform X2 [Hippopotamus amphibius kiboko]XP_057572423.1 growth factor receptor-bound protein 7 isoform X2 [Hippopotamus amphibius kiboko]
MELGLSPPHLSSSPEDLYLAPGTPPGTPPPPDVPLSGEVKRSQPVPIPTSRKLLREEELRSTSLPSIPNPFPELCSPPSQTPILGGPSSARGLLPRDRDTSCPHVIKVYSEDGACRSVEVAAGATARYVCEMLIQRSHALSDENWGLVECHPHLALERVLEDHESVVEVQAAWPIGADSRFVFRKNFAKYELFKSTAHSLFPEKMVSSCLDAHTGLSHEDLIQNFLNAGSFPEIQGFLQLRGSGRKLWKRFFCFLRRSGLYYSTKGTSKDPRHLQYVADVNESNVYVVTQGRKLYGMPTDFGFCIKPNKLGNGHKGLRVFCSEDEQGRRCWLAAFRLFKYGVQLYKNYQQALCRHLRPPCVGSPPLRSVPDNTLVAMDFSGHAGRVIENPREALSAALEEAQAWRRVPGPRESAEPTGLCPLSVPRAESQTLPYPAERGGGAPVLQHGRGPDSLHRPPAARGVPPAEPRHPALLAAPLLHPRGPLTTPQAARVSAHSGLPAPSAPRADSEGAEGGARNIVNGWGALPLQFSPLLLASFGQKGLPAQSTLNFSFREGSWMAVSPSRCSWALLWARA